MLCGRVRTQYEILVGLH